MQPIRFGILGAGAIAAHFVQALRAVEGAELAAVASRDLEKAQRFAAEHGAARAHGSYRALAEDPGVDIVYVATITPFHEEHVLLCLNAGKAVLCEKPFAVNAAQARRMADCAVRNGVLLMEAMWTRYLPATQQARRWVREGAIGEPKMLFANLNVSVPFDPASRLQDISIAGGAALDIGCYVVAEAFCLMGAPVAGSAQAQIGVTGVDVQDAMILRHEGGGLSILTSAMHTVTPCDAAVYGTEGAVLLPGFQGATAAILRRNGAAEQRFEQEPLANGFEYEIREAVRCFREGRTETPYLPLRESVAIMEALDGFRRDFGLRYAVAGEAE